MDLDIEYYSSRCNDINGLWVFKGTFMTFVGGDSDHQTVFHSKIKELFASVGVDGDALMPQSRHYKTWTSASILAIYGLNWESWVLHKVEPALSGYVCLPLLLLIWGTYKHVPCPLLISVFLYPSVVFLSWYYSMTKNQVNSMSIEDMDDAGGRNCHETADMRALWSLTNFIPEDRVRFYWS